MDKQLDLGFDVTEPRPRSATDGAGSTLTTTVDPEKGARIHHRPGCGRRGGQPRFDAATGSGTRCGVRDQSLTCNRAMAPVATTNRPCTTAAIIIAAINEWLG